MECTVRHGLRRSAEGGGLRCAAARTSALMSSRALRGRHPKDQAAGLIARVAALIPVPGDALGADEKAGAAFDDLVGEAAGLVVRAVGPTGAARLRAFLRSPLGEEALPRLLVERALDLLSTEPRPR